MISEPSDENSELTDADAACHAAILDENGNEFPGALDISQLPAGGGANCDGPSAIDLITQSERIEIIASGMRDIFKWINEPVNTEQVGRRSKVVTLLLWPEMLGIPAIMGANPKLRSSGTFGALAQKEGVTKQTIHALASKFRAEFGFETLSMRSETARQSMRESYERRHDDPTTASNT